MKKTNTPASTKSINEAQVAVLSPDAQTVQDFKLSLFIVSITINFLLFIFWLTVQFVAING